MTVAGCALSAIPSVNAFEQELRRPDGSDLSKSIYFADRCAGAYLAVVNWAGEQRLGAEAYNNTLAVVQAYIVLSISGRVQQRSATDSEASQAVMRDVKNIAEIYVTRFESNYALRGDSMVGDALVENDLALCGRALDGGR